VVSTCANDKLGRMSGTSQATGLVSAGAAYLSQRGLLDPERLRFRIQYTADDLPWLRDELAFGRFDLMRAIPHDQDLACPAGKESRRDLSENRVIVTGCEQWAAGRFELGIMLDDGGGGRQFQHLFGGARLALIGGPQGVSRVFADDLLRVVLAPVESTYVVHAIRREQDRREGAVEGIDSFRGIERIVWNDDFTKDVVVRSPDDRHRILTAELADFVRRVGDPEFPTW
jgi:hypothetical protein